MRAITLHLEYLSLLGCWDYSASTPIIYTEDSNKTVTKIQVWASLTLSAVVIVFPPAIFTQLINPFLIVMFGVLFYIFMYM